MKNHVSLLTLAATLLLGACSTYEELPATSGSSETTVGFLADIAPREQSRADIDIDFGTGLTGTWNGEDNLGVLANDFSKLLQFTYAPDSKAFKGPLTGTKGDWAYRAFYPHNGNATVSGTTVTLPFNALRTQKGNKYNSEFDIMAADAISCIGANPGETTEGDAVKFNLHRITSILALKLQGGSSAEKIASVMLTAEKPIASEQLTFTIPSDPNAAYDPSAISPALVAGGTSATGAPISIDSKHITVTYADGTAPSADYSETFFNVLPDDNYGNLTFSICTDKGNAASILITRSTPVAANWVYTVDQTARFATAAAPMVEWLGHEDPSARYELAESGNSADIQVSAPGGIKSMQVDITSSVLTTPMGEGEPSLLESVHLAPSMNLTNPANNEMAASLAELGFPTPAQLLNQQSVFFQIGGLIDLLAAVSPTDQTTTADFKFAVTDNAGSSFDITLKFVKTSSAPAIVYNEDADLWANTASFTLSNIPSDATSVSVQYKKSTASATEWQTAEITGNNTKAEIKPNWTSFTTPDWSTPNATDNTVLPFQRIATGTGVFAGNTYDYKLIVDGSEYTGQFTTDAGNTITDGSLENWESAQLLPGGSTGSLFKPYSYNFWGCGYNSYAKELCTRDDTKIGRVGTYCAKLAASYNTTGKVPAPGNLFTGDFKVSISPMGGYVSFGKQYAYNARPRAVKFKYHATIGPVDYNLHNGKIAVGEMDKARVMVCIVDWTAQQQVFAGKNAPSGTWDPETQKSTDKGAIIGYASKFIEESTVGDEMVEVSIPINYYENTATPPSQAYNIVISCSTSAFGDYMDACTSNIMYIDNFEWVY